MTPWAFEVMFYSKTASWNSYAFCMGTTAWLVFIPSFHMSSQGCKMLNSWLNHGSLGGILVGDKEFVVQLFDQLGRGSQNLVNFTVSGSAVVR